MSKKRLEAAIRERFFANLARDRSHINRLDPEQAVILILACLGEAEDFFGLPPRVSPPLGDHFIPQRDRVLSP